MSRKANPTAIGAFTLGALTLVIAAVVIFGSGKLFTSRPRAVVFFQGNMQGLSVGAPVTLRGVEVGSVAEIRLRLNVKTMEPVIPVYLSFDPSRFRASGGDASPASTDMRDQLPLRTAIANGLHARLATQSLVTGQLLVELDLDPSEPRKVVGADPDTIEIPTSEADIEKFKNKVLQLPIDKIADATLQLLDAVETVVSSPEIPKLLHSLVSASTDAEELLVATRTHIETITGEFKETAQTTRQTLQTAQGALTEIRATAATANRLADSDGRQLIALIGASLKNVNQLIIDANSLLASNSPQRYDIDQTLKNLADTSRSLRIFSEELQRRPNSMIVGK